MIQKLRRRLVAIIMILLSVIFILIIFAINYMNYSMNTRESRFMLTRTIRTVGMDRFLRPNSKNVQLKNLDYATVQISDSKDLSVLVNRIPEYTDEQLLEFSQKAYKRFSERGSIEHLVYIKRHYLNHEYYIFMDNTYAFENTQSLLIMSLCFGLLGLALLFIASLYLSRMLVRPVEESFTAQRQFISNASHELKTPLTIINANAGLLQEEIGNNKQLEYIHSETSHMSSLVNQLLTLARMDAAQEKENFEVFPLGKALLTSVLPFESLAFEENITLETEIDETLSYRGNKEELQQLVSILVDNAIKHTPAQGKVVVNAHKDHKRVYLSVANMGEAIPEEERKKIFERFYQVDEARSNQGDRYGLGLSIADSVAKKHHGKIAVACDRGWTTFKVSLPC